MNQIQAATEARFSCLFEDPSGINARQTIAFLTNLMMAVHFRNPESGAAQNKSEAIQIAMSTMDNSVKMSACLVAKTEMIGWIREYFDGLSDAEWSDGDGHESVVRQKFGLRYWERVGELAGVVLANP